MVLTGLASGMILFRTAHWVVKNFHAGEPPVSPSLSRPALPSGFTHEFRRYYDKRRPGEPCKRPDPAIGGDLDLMVDSAVRLLKEGVSPGRVEGLIEPACRHAVGNFDWAPSDGSCDISLNTKSASGYRFIIARMGPVTRMAVFDHLWNRIALPAELLWTYLWGNGPSVKSLPSGMIFLSETGFYSEGNRDRIRVTWLAIRHSAARIVGEFEGMTTLDYLQPAVRGNRVCLTTVDTPRTFSVCMAEATLRHDRTWDCSRDRLKLIRDEALQPGLRVVDQTIWNAWHARHPSKRQLRIKSLWPEDDLSLECSEKWRGRKGVVTVGWSTRFELRYVAKGKPIVLGVRLLPSHGLTRVQ